MTERIAAGRKTDQRDDPFETILLDLFRDSAAGASRGFATLQQHEKLAEEEKWLAYEHVKFFGPERVSLMRMVDSTARLATAAARLRHEGNQSLKLAIDLQRRLKGEGVRKNAGSIPQENVAAIANDMQAAE